ncbi:MAG: AAA family ATPase [Caulobacterales bacterium]
MSGSQADISWSISDSDEDEFILEDDETFGLGDIEGAAEPPPMDSDDLIGDIEQIDSAEPFTLASPPPFANDDRLTEQPIPRITIHAACDRPDIARLLEGISSDRRMARAEITVEQGGIEAALTRFASMASPNLLIIDTVQQGAQMLQSLDRLAQVIEEGTKVVIIGAINDIPLFRELMRRGVSEYIVPPILPLELIRTVCGLYVSAEKPFAGRVISVIGARGGIGASTLAHNIAWSIAERQEAGATLIDLDLSFGTAALDFNQDPQQSIADALLAPDRVDEVLLERLTTKHTQRLQMLTAPATLEREFELDPSAFETVIERVRRTSPFIVLDLPHTWSSWIKQTILSADDVVIVGGPDLASLRNSKNISDHLRAARPYDAAPHMVLNMQGVPKRPEIPLKDFAEALGAEPVAAIPFDPGLFGMAANNGQMIGEFQPAHKTALVLDALAASLTGRRPIEVKKTQLNIRIPFMTR